MPEEASLIITNSGVPGFVPVPGLLAFGELSLNWADSALYFKDVNGVVQSISVAGPPALELDHIPVREGPWFSIPFPMNPANTAYMVVQKAAGDVPRFKIGTETFGVNNVSVDGVDITVTIRDTTPLTTNQIKALIEANEEANALIYFYNATGSDGTGTATPGVLSGASFNNANIIIGDRADYVGQRAITTHSNSTYTEWTAVQARPNTTVWSPITSGVIFNNTVNRWEKMYSQDGTFQSDLLPDQAPI